MSRWLWALFSLTACNAVENKVASDTVAQYEIAKVGGNKIDICVHAGLVAAAYLQAEDQPNYLKWKAVEKADCAAADVPH